MMDIYVCLTLLDMIIYFHELNFLCFIVCLGHLDLSIMHFINKIGKQTFQGSSPTLEGLSRLYQLRPLKNERLIDESDKA